VPDAAGRDFLMQICHLILPGFTEGTSLRSLRRDNWPPNKGRGKWGQGREKDATVRLDDDKMIDTQRKSQERERRCNLCCAKRQRTSNEFYVIESALVS
jgi:hypothetical protein